MTTTKVSIIILNWNGKNLTIECLDSLKQIEYPDFNIIIVDNGSTDGSTEHFRNNYQDIDIIENNKNLGYAEGNNVGIRYAIEKYHPNYILLLNNDTIVDKNFLNELVKVAKTDPKIGFAGPKVYFYDFQGKKDIISFAGGMVDLWKGMSIHIGENEQDRRQHDEIRYVDYVEGSCLLVSTEMLKNIGLLDASYFLYWEETDLCIRGKNAGYKSCYVPASMIWHKVGASTIGSGNLFYLTRNRFWFMKKYADRKQYRSFLLYFMFHDVPEMSRHLIFHRNIKGLKAFYKGFFEGLSTYNRTGNGNHTQVK